MITLILVEIFEPPIMHVTGFFLFSRIELSTNISFFKSGPP